MNQTVYFKNLIFILSLLVFVTSLDATLLKPSENGEKKEILIINKKRRVYYPIQGDGISYIVKGPTRLEFISRFPVLKNKKKSHSFEYSIVLNQNDTIQVNHRYKVQKSIKSVQHPIHKYTYSGNYFINIPDGNHHIQLIASASSKYPVLSRVLSKDFERTKGNIKDISPMVHQSVIPLEIQGKSKEYYACTKEIPLQIESKGPKTIKMFSRLVFDSQMGTEASYRLKVKNGTKVIGTYYFNTEKSSETTIPNHPDWVPGKWRSCEFPVPKGRQIYTIELLGFYKTVLTRFIEY